MVRLYTIADPDPGFFSRVGSGSGSTPDGSDPLVTKRACTEQAINISLSYNHEQVLETYAFYSRNIEKYHLSLNNYF